MYERCNYLNRRFCLNNRVTLGLSKRTTKSSMEVAQAFADDFRMRKERHGFSTHEYCDGLVKIGTANSC